MAYAFVSVSILCLNRARRGFIRKKLVNGDTEFKTFRTIRYNSLPIRPCKPLNV